jgi:hypothetical protein
LPEIHNPGLQPRHPDGNNNLRSLLAFSLLFVTLLFGYQYIVKSTPSAPTPASQTQSPTLQAEIAKAPVPAFGGHSIAPPTNFGWLTFIAKPLYLELRFLHGHGIGNWGWAIIALTVVLNMLTLWPRIMSMKSSLKMMRIQPKVEALKRRYAHLKINDPKRMEMNAEMMALYKAEGANMFWRLPAHAFADAAPICLYERVAQRSRVAQGPLALALGPLLAGPAAHFATPYRREHDPDAVHYTLTSHDAIPAEDSRNPDARCHGFFSLALRLRALALLGHRQPHQPVYPMDNQSQQDGQGDARPCSRTRHD